MQAETEEDLLHDQHISLQNCMSNPIAFHAEMMGDIMYFHQAMKQQDAPEFIKAVVKKVDACIQNNHWKLLKWSEVPRGIDVIPSVWSMRCKQNFTTNDITKYKAWLNIHGGKQVYGMNYFETYAPVVTWFAVRLMIVFTIVFGWSLRQIDFVQAYAQAPIETDMYIELPQGIQAKHWNWNDYVLKLLANHYGEKQAG